MICQKCKKDFVDEGCLDESHDVPCYLFNGITRRERKNKADKFPRHWLCKDCHYKYEEGLRISFRLVALDFSDKFFGEENDE